MKLQITGTGRRMERVKGIEPSSSAWKAVALPLSYTRIRATRCGGRRRIDWRLAALARRASEGWWRGLDSNQRRHSQRIYSPSPLATRAPLREITSLAAHVFDAP